MRASHTKAKKGGDMGEIGVEVWGGGGGGGGGGGVRYGTF